MQSAIDKLKELATEMKDRSHYAYLFVDELEEIIKELENPWRPNADVPQGERILIGDGYVTDDYHGDQSIGWTIYHPTIAEYVIDDYPCEGDGNFHVSERDETLIIVDVTKWHPLPQPLKKDNGFKPLPQPPREGEL